MSGNFGSIGILIGAVLAIIGGVLMGETIITPVKNSIHAGECPIVDAAGALDSSGTQSTFKRNYTDICDNQVASATVEEVPATVERGMLAVERFSAVKSIAALFPLVYYAAIISLPVVLIMYRMRTTVM